MSFACPSLFTNCSPSPALALISSRRNSYVHRTKINALRTTAAAPISLTLGTTRRRRRNTNSVRCSSVLSPELKSTLDKVVTSHKVVIFIKGTKDFPQCGFSNTVVQILKSFNVPFESINILENELLRQGLKEYSSWPTFPQVYIDGDFFGGCDIIVEAYQSGELQEVLEKAMCS